MADKDDRDGDRRPKSAALRLAEEMQRRPFAAAAVAGGAAAAAAAGYIGARAIARRNGACAERPLNQVLKTAITATQCNSAPVAPDTTDPDPEIGLDGS
jgi:alkyl hydroperoxide reductase subunit AhpF